MARKKITNRIQHTIVYIYIYTPCDNEMAVSNSQRRESGMELLKRKAIPFNINEYTLYD